jgi:prepilin-type N-terminal cleavage/methylation domain-containing protein
MSARPTRRRPRGFTLLEVVTVVAIVGVVAAVAAPSISAALAANRFQAAARALVGVTRQARGAAITRRDVRGITPRTVGLRVVSATQLQTFADPDDEDDGDEVLMETFDLAGFDATRAIEFDPAAIGSVVRFDRRGSASAAATYVLVQRRQGLRRTITLATSGLASVD